jgi:cytochrome b561
MDSTMKGRPGSNAGGGSYDGVAILLHWLMALAILGSFCVGVYMADLPLSPARIRIFNYHKWAGITILCLAALRLLWRLTHTPPAEPASLKPWEVVISAWTHRALYLLFFLVPLAGWAFSSAAGFPVVWFGVLPLPDLLPKDKPTAELLETVHGALAWTLGVLFALHAAAALKHRFLDKDGVMDRMLPASVRRR